MSMRIEVKVPGSCGELVQGTAAGVPFLVTCPVNLYTRLILASGERRLAGFGSKAQMALERTLDYLGVKAFPFDMTLQSQLPCGKGMASSSADIAAVCIGAAAARVHAGDGFADDPDVGLADLSGGHVDDLRVG